MPIGFNCDDCGQCDECLGITWGTLNAKPLTKKQVKDGKKFASMLGKNARQTIDKIALSVINKEGK